METCSSGSVARRGLSDVRMFRGAQNSPVTAGSDGQPVSGSFFSFPSSFSSFPLLFLLLSHYYFLMSLFSFKQLKMSIFILAHSS